jgi:ceramide glucosyltransferase
MLASVLLAIALLGTLTSTAYVLLVCLGVLRFCRRRRAEIAFTDFTPPVSILKPLHGLEPNLEQNLESFFRQDYPEFELIFCARRADDPGLALARRLAERFPHVPIRLLTCGEPPWMNAKLYSLERMWTHARYELLIISDSDVRVGKSYLREVVKPFRDVRVGLNTCIYRGLPVGGFWTQIEALGMSVEMTAGVLVAEMMEGMKFALGPTMVVRKECLQALNGFGFMADYCADDYILGNAIADSGMKVALSHHSVEHAVVHHSFAASFAHQVRWMRSTRFSRPKGHLGSLLTYAMPYGVVGFIAALATGRPILGTMLLAWAIGNRILQSILAGYLVAGDRNALVRCWLFPIRDLLGGALWLASYFSSSINWRGEAYRLVRGGRMLRGTAATLPVGSKVATETRTAGRS